MVVVRAHLAFECPRPLGRPTEAYVRMRRELFVSFVFKECAACLLFSRPGSAFHCSTMGTVRCGIYPRAPPGALKLTTLYGFGSAYEDLLPGAPAVTTVMRGHSRSPSGKRAVREPATPRQKKCALFPGSATLHITVHLGGAVPHARLLLCRNSGRPVEGKQSTGICKPSFSRRVGDL